MTMEENQINNRGYVICTQCITEGAVVQQMRPLRDWADHEWYNDAMADPKKVVKAASAEKAAKKKKKKACAEKSKPAEKSNPKKKKK